MSHHENVLNDIKRLPKAPEHIDILGRLTEEDKKNIIVIGSRNMSKYGKNVIENLVPKLVSDGFTIISGLAPGCDSYAQAMALKSGGRTVGVLGYGVDRIRTDWNKEFIEQVLANENGVVLSPFKRTQPPTRESFIFRNSVMAALGKNVLVIEARRRSGVFHTVNFALELGRPIMAVPGSIFWYNSGGVHALIKEGANLVSSFEDIKHVIG